MSDLTSDPRHREVWDLLPWLANGTLAPPELDAVLDHLKSCEQCREELRFLPELRYMAESGAVAAGAHPAEAPAVPPRLRSRIAQLERRPSWRLRPWLGGGSRSGGAWPPRLLALQAALLVAFLATGGWWLATRPTHPPTARPAEFHTLSQPSAPVADGAPLLRLIVADTTPELALRRLVLDLEGEIVGGPTTAGAYTVRLERTPPADLETVLTELRSRRDVVFAEPAQGRL